MNSIWIQLSLTYFIIAHIVLWIVVKHPQSILPKFMKSWLILNNFILRSKGIYVTKEQNAQFYQKFQDNNKKMIQNTQIENQNFQSYNIKNKIVILKERLLLYLKFMAYIWWIYLLVILIGKVLIKIDITLEDQL